MKKSTIAMTAAIAAASLAHTDVILKIAFVICHVVPRYLHDTVKMVQILDFLKLFYIKTTFKGCFVI